jgi:hypothetical protein
MGRLPISYIERTETKEALFDSHQAFPEHSKDGNGADMDGYVKTRSKSKSISLTLPHPLKYPWAWMSSKSKPTGYRISMGLHTIYDEVRPQQCPCLRAFESWSACGIRRTRRRSDDIGRHRFYPGSAPLLGNDLRPACLTLLMG